MVEKRFWSEDHCIGYYTEVIDNDKELEDVPNPKKNLTIGEVVDTLNELHSENEQFKQSQKSILRELLIYRRIASCSNCKYQNYDWFDDGDEFEICEKGNNEQQIAYHICKEWREI